MATKALLEREVVDRVLLLADDVGRKRGHIADVACRDGEAQVLCDHVREAAGGPVAGAADHGAVPEQGEEPVAVLDGLVGDPVRIDAGREQPHEVVAIPRGDVVRLNDADVVVGGGGGSSPASGRDSSGSKVLPLTGAEIELCAKGSTR
jgi:hypothetical protein